MKCVLSTGQQTCHDAAGKQINCTGTGQDAEFHTGLAWASPRFRIAGATASDLLTGLTWPLDANIAGFPLDWQAAIDFISDLNHKQALGFSDWRLPERRELRSLLSCQAKNPALPEGHPFEDVFPGWYWTATAAAVDPHYSWYIHLGGGRTFYAARSQYYLVWPVRGDVNEAMRCPAHAPRFVTSEDGAAITDLRTGLQWRTQANLTGDGVTWQEALDAISALSNERDGDQDGPRRWRLPNINELDSLVDLGHYAPALPGGHPFLDFQDVYWSSTTSFYEPDWAWALYLNKGALGVGRKSYARFHVWAVSGG